MTLTELVAALTPVTNAALASTDVEVRKVAVILCAVLGCIDQMGDLDKDTLDVLALQAGLICDHRLGRHVR